MRKYSSFWHISEKVSEETAFLFKDLEKTLSYKGEQITTDPVSHVIKVDINNCCYYIKIYTQAGKRFKKFIGKSRFQGEWENLLFFQKLGIPTPEIIAYGQESRFKIFKKGAVVLKEVKNTMDLALISREKPELLKQKKWIEQIGVLYAEYARRLHKNRFVHMDLKWRNILVTLEKDPKVFFIDCPSGHKRFGPFLNYAIMKDLACLDKIARHHLSKTTRLKFYLTYKGKNSINEENPDRNNPDRNKIDKKDKKLIKKILNHFS